jgi:hypothetical protein
MSNRADRPPALTERNAMKTYRDLDEHVPFDDIPMLSLDGDRLITAPPDDADPAWILRTVACVLEQMDTTCNNARDTAVALRLVRRAIETLSPAAGNR